MGQENILAACYYAELVEAQSDFGLAEIGALLDLAKVPRPSNLPRDLKALSDKRKRYLNVVKGSSGSITRYTLTNLGADVINDRMQQAGLVLTKPVERTELLKEVSESLHTMIQQIPNQHEREYIEEAISCLSPVNNASRAAIVMGWAGTVFNLRRKVDRQGVAGYSAFTTHLQNINLKAKPVADFNDLEDIKDIYLLDICEKMNIIKGKSVKNQLNQWLDFRNGVGHPTNVKPGIYKVKAFFEDIIQYVLAVP